MRKLTTGNLVSVLCLSTLLGCSDSSDRRSIEPVVPKTEAQLLRAQFGPLESVFTDQAMQSILDYEDASSPVTLMQLIQVSKEEMFASYESQIAPVWEAASAEQKFASTIVAELIGERPYSDVRLIEFPNILMLLDTINSQAFTDAMETLFQATSDHAWVLGRETALPFEPMGSFSDSSLLNLDKTQAQALLEQQSSKASRLESDPQVIIDMIVSDNPDPFWMVNLIDFYDEANYPDGRESDLSGKEANEIYGSAIIPRLLAYSSYPSLVMDIDIVLTRDDIGWEQAAMVRYASRDAFLRIFALSNETEDVLIHKEAGVENTLVNVSEMAESMIPEPQAGFLYNLRYCEVLLASLDSGRVRADVYNSLGLNFCPQALWEALDSEAIAAEFGVLRALLNGPRFWVLDTIINNGDVLEEQTVESFGDIDMRLAASVLLPQGGSLDNENENSAYKVAEVSRDTVFGYVAGRQIYELHDPEGNRYIMQSFSRILDEDLQLSELATLGERLALPAGWRFLTRTLAFPLNLSTVDGIARVVTDNLSNTYQQLP
ncbi:MAG: hypothetical protein AB8B81_09870 [Halioglobus sp.]